MFFFYIFTLLMFRKTNKTTIIKNKTINSFRGEADKPTTKKR